MTQIKTKKTDIERMCSRLNLVVDYSTQKPRNVKYFVKIKKFIDKADLFYS